MALVEIKNLVKHFPVRGGMLNRVQAHVHAVNGVDLEINKGEILGVVGESGCGKSTLGKLLNRLIEPTAGSIKFDGVELTGLSHNAMMPFRRKMQIIFQDPYSSLNPRFTVKQALGEGVLFHQICDEKQLDDYIVDILTKVGLRGDDRHKFPHEFSGGQRQRIGIARALAVKPEFIIADEPVSALDVSIQAQILNLMLDLKDEFGLTMLFISHDLKVVEHFCDRMQVMYLGTVMERMSCDALVQDAKHPYTRALLGSNPINDPDDRRPLTILEGDVPSPFNPPPGCPFASRCEKVEALCSESIPPLIVDDKNHATACHVVNR